MVTKTSYCVWGTKARLSRDSFSTITKLFPATSFFPTAEQEFQEIKSILNQDGKFIITYINFGHLRGKYGENTTMCRRLTMAESLKEVFRSSGTSRRRTIGGRRKINLDISSFVWRQTRPEKGRHSSHIQSCLGEPWLVVIRTPLRMDFRV